MTTATAPVAGPAAPTVNAHVDGTPLSTESTARERFISDRSWWLAFAAIVAIGLAVRLWLLVQSNWFLDADEATMGLTGLAILNDGDRPIFYPGQAYMGAWQAYLCAALFELFGMSRPVAKLVPLASSAAFVATTMLLARRVYNRNVALLAGLFAAIPSLYLISTTLRLSYPLIDVMAIGNVVLLLAIDTTYRQDPPRRYWLRCLAIGLLTGFGFWLHSAVLVYAAPVALLLLARWPRRALLVAAPVGLAGFVAGALPVFEHARTHDYTTFDYLRGTDADVAQRDYLRITEHLVRVLLPRYLGVSAPWQDTATLLQFMVAIPTVIALVYLVARSWRAPLAWLRRKPQDTHPEVVLLLFGAIVAAAYIFSRFSVYAITVPSVDATGRYVAPLGTLIPIALAGAAWHASRTGDLGRSLATLGICAVLLGTVANYARTDAEQVFQSPYYRDVPVDNAELIDTLDDLGVDAVWIDQWAGRPLMFDTARRIAAADYVDLRGGGLNRHADAMHRVDGSPRPAFVFITTANPAAHIPLERALQQRRVPIQSRVLDDYAVVVPDQRIDPSSVLNELAGK